MSLVLREEDNHVIIKMPNGEVTLYENKKMIVPVRLFKLEINAEKQEEPVLEFLLWNSWGPVLDVYNIGLDNIYSKFVLSPKSTIHVTDQTILIKTNGDSIFQISVSDENIYIMNASKNASEVLKPIKKGDKVSLTPESPLVDCEGKTILSIAFDDWINEEWDPDNEW